MKRTVLIFVCLLCQLINIVSTGFLECSDSSECKVSAAVCKNNMCECPLGQVYNLESTKCLSIAIGMEAECEDDAQCGWLLGKHRCNMGKCDCAEGWRYIEGQCIKSYGFNESCIVDKDCFNSYDILAMICKDGVCGCNEGYYLRGDYDCRPEITEFGDYCSLNSDCKMENGVCSNSKCINSANYIVPNAYQVEDASSIDHVDANKDNNFNYDVDCELNEECSTQFANSVCYPLTKKCICKRGYFLANGVCTPEFGVDIKCTANDECPISLGWCNPKDGKCYCRKTYFYSKSNRACQKPMTHDNVFCNTAERCYVYGTEVTCLTNKCRCKTTAELDDNFVCRTVEDQGGCNSDEECTEIINSICSENAECECPQNYRLENTTCLPNIGGKCDDITKVCTIENAHCGTDEICSCIDSHVAHGTTSCLKRSTGLNDTCEIDLQCSDLIEHTICASNNTCQCTDNYIARNEMCFQQKFMGDICTKSGDCHIMLGDNVQCRNSICQCSADMQPSTDGFDCVSAASSIVLQMETAIFITVGYLTLKYSM